MKLLSVIPLFLSLITLGVGGACDTNPTPDAADRTILLVGNKSDNTLSWLDVDSGEILGTTTTGSGPHEVTITPDGKWAFVANYEGDGDSISLIDVEKMEEVRRISIDPYRAPHGIQASADGKSVFATVERSQAVIEIDIATEKVIRSFNTGQSVTHMLVLSQDAAKVYTASIGSGTSSVINLAAADSVKHIVTGAGAEGIDITPDGGHVWVTNRESDTVSIIDTQTDTKVADLAATGFPIRVKITPDGKYALVSAARSGDVIVFDVASRKLVKRVSTGATPVGIVIDANGERAFIANTQANTISVMSIPGFEITGTLRAGNTPDGMVLVP
jgi:YVTN family beta-propeller protein